MEIKTKYSFCNIDFMLKCYHWLKYFKVIFSQKEYCQKFLEADYDGLPIIDETDGKKKYSIILLVKNLKKAAYHYLKTKPYIGENIRFLIYEGESLIKRNMEKDNDIRF